MFSIDTVGKYYAQRAQEYQASVSYSQPTNLATMAQVKARYQLALSGHDVLEIACGPGYWTQVVALTARSVLATDVNPEVLALTSEKLSWADNVRCQVADAYSLEGVTGRFTAAFAQFWWSHVPQTKLREFLAALHSKLNPGALVMFLDTLPYYSRGGRRWDENGDLLEHRTLCNGMTFEIIKNFPTKRQITDALAGSANDVVYRQFRADGYWTVSYRTNG